MSEQTGSITFDIAPPEDLCGAAPVLLVGLCRDGEPALCPPFVQSEVSGAVAALARAAGFEGKAGQVRLVANTGAGPLPKTLMLVGLGQRERMDRLSVERGFAQAVRELRGGELPHLAMLPALEGEFAEMVGPLVDAAVIGSHLGAPYLPEERRQKAAPPERVVLVMEGESEALRAALATAQALAEATNLARDLAGAPACDLTPPALADRVQTMAKAAGLQCEIWKKKRIAAHGMNLLLAVGQGSAHEPRLVKITYKPEGRASGTLVLVGKGITFDTGGIDLKKPKNLDAMRGDKAGAAAVVATLLACKKTKPPIKVIGILACAENAISEKAYKPGDVFLAADGRRVEIGDTDAEGRLVLADALHYAAGLAPTGIVDVATLTGSCVVGLGPQVAGLFASDESLAEAVLQASDEAGERLWPLPLESLYRSELDSEVADLKNVGGRYGDAVHAALFLSEFAGGVPWAHMDIAGPSWLDEANPAQAAGATGYGVRTLGHFLLGLH